jgi:hypothetical protein
MKFVQHLVVLRNENVHIISIGRDIMEIDDARTKLI